MTYLRIFLTGMMISFLGTLPLGTLNISAMQISLADGWWPAYFFVFGALLVEMIYVRLSLVAMDWFRRKRGLMRWMEWITLGIVLALTLSSFWAAMHTESPKNPILSGGLHRFWLGVAMSAVNPMQVPFWFGWSSVLFERGLLQKDSRGYPNYIAGIGFGTLLGNSVFISGGRLLVNQMDNNAALIQWIIGGIFLVTAIIQGWRMWRARLASTREPGN